MDYSEEAVSRQTVSFPLDKIHLVVVTVLFHQEVSPKCVNEEASTKRRSYNHQVNRFPGLIDTLLHSC